MSLAARRHLRKNQNLNVARVAENYQVLERE